MIVIIARNILRKGMKKSFLEAVEPLIAQSRAESGNISYHLYEDTEYSDAVCFIESWKDTAAIAAHNASPHFKKWIENKERLVEKSEVNRYIKKE